MSHWNDKFWVIYALLSPISAICSGILLCTLSGLVSSGGHPHLENVFWMSFSDLVLSLRHFIEYFYYHPTMKHYEIPCLISALLGQFGIVATTSWYFVIGVNIYLTFNGVGRHTLSRYIGLSHIYVWFISCVCSLGPLIFGAYDGMPDDGTCWILNHYRSSSLFFIVPLGVYLFFSFILLIFVWRKSDSLELIQVRRNILPFIVAFCATWIWALLWDSWKLFPIEQELPEFIRYLNIVAVSATGFTNFMVWFVLNDIFRFKKRTIRCMRRCCFEYYVEDKPIDVANAPVWEVVVSNLTVQDSFDGEKIGILPRGAHIKGQRNENWLIHDMGWSMIVNKNGKHNLTLRKKKKK